MELSGAGTELPPKRKPGESTSAAPIAHLRRPQCDQLRQFGRPPLLASHIASRVPGGELLKGLLLVLGPETRAGAEAGLLDKGGAGSHGGGAGDKRGPETAGGGTEDRGGHVGGWLVGGGRWVVVGGWWRGELVVLPGYDETTKNRRLKRFSHVQLALPQGRSSELGWEEKDGAFRYGRGGGRGRRAVERETSKRRGRRGREERKRKGKG